MEHTIKTLPDCKPVKLRPYRIPLAKREFAENEIQAMAEKGLIEPSHSAWSAPAVLVPKRDGTTRFCTGFGKCRHLRVKSMPLAFTGIFRNNPEYSGITWHFRKNYS